MAKVIITLTDDSEDPLMPTRITVDGFPAFDMTGQDEASLSNAQRNAVAILAYILENAEHWRINAIHHCAADPGKAN